MVSAKVSGRWWMNQFTLSTLFFSAAVSIFTVGIHPHIVIWMDYMTYVHVVLDVTLVQASTFSTVPAVIRVPCAIIENDEFHLLWFLLATGNNIYLH